MALKLEIVTPEKIAYDSAVDSVVLPTSDGEIDVLPGHIPLLSAIEAGELEVVSEGRKDFLAVDKGYVEVYGDTVRALTEAAIDIDDIDLNSAAEAQRRAEDALREARESGEDPAVLEQLETQARFAVIQKLAKERRR